jgi:hypothetical protein
MVSTFSCSKSICTVTTGALSLDRNYDPFGNVEADAGIGSNMAGFTREQTDSYIKLIDLRSRMYSLGTLHFLIQILGREIITNHYCSIDV